MKKKLLAFALLFATMLTLSACSIKDTQIYFTTNSGLHTVFKIDNLSCSSKEAKLYLANYKNLYGDIGEADLWNGEYDTSAMEESLKSAVLSHLTRVYSLNLYGRDNDITLTEDELEKVKEAADEYYNSLSKAERKYTGVSKSDVSKFYEHYALAEKVFAQLMSTVDEEVSEDEARVMQAYELYTTDAALAKTIDIQIKNGATFERLASSYNEDTSTRVTFGRGTYPEEVEAVVFNLDDKETSECIETDNGYYFFQCINKYDETLSEENKIKIVQNRKDEVINEMINELDVKYYAHLNESLWKRIEIDDNSEIKTSSFFEILDEHISF